MGVVTPSSEDPHPAPDPRAPDPRDADRRAADRRAADRLLVRVARNGGAWMAVLAAAALTLAAAETVLPAAMGRAVDAVLGGHDGPRWLEAFALVVAVLVAGDALDSLATGASSARSTARLRTTLLAHVLGLGVRADRHFPGGDISSRLVANTAEAARVAPDAVRAVANLIPALGAVVALALIDPWVCLTFLAAVPLFLAVLRTFVRDASELARRYLEVQGRIAGRLVDALAGGRTIAAAGTAEHEAERVLAPLPDLHRHGLGMWHALTRVSAQDALLVPLVEVVVLAVAGLELTRGRITAGGLLAAAQYVALASNLGGALATANRLTRARAAAGRVAEVLDEPVMRYGSRRLPPGGGRLEFRAVTVSSGHGRALDRVDLVIPEGALVAVVGRSGAGKSLLAAVAGRLVDPDEGVVLLDGVPLPEIERWALRRAVGYGFERPVLMGESLADTIAFGAFRPPFREVEAAARAARAHDFLRRMPRGYWTALTDAPMSGGEVQRIGLARAFAHAGRVLILDDVAASLDTVTEHHISTALTRGLAERTRLVVAHRTSTVALADLVVWLQRGRVRAVGTHVQLWQDPRYRAVFGPEGDRSRKAAEPSTGGDATNLTPTVPAGAARAEEVPA